MQALGFKPGVVTTGNSLDHVPEDDRIMAENGKIRCLYSHRSVCLTQRNEVLLSRNGWVDSIERETELLMSAAAVVPA
jgi:hypothetical protein